MNPPREPSTELLRELLTEGRAEQLQAALAELPPGDTARLVTRLDEDEQRQLLALLPADDAAYLLKELSLPQAADMLRLAPLEQAAEVFEQFPSNEQVDLVAEMGDDAGDILIALPKETLERIQQLSEYGPETAGGLMVTEYLAFHEDLRVADVIDDLRSHSPEYARLDVQYVYTLDDAGRLTGVLRLRDLLLLNHGDPLAKATIPEPRRVRTDTTLDELMRFFDRHPYFGVPVVDDHDRLVGVVLRADVEEAFSDQAGRGLLLTSGVLGGEEFRSMSWGERVLRRSPWLGMSLLLSLVAASVIGWYEDTLAAALALAVFLPVISGMGGNSGNQALAVSIRELALGLVRPQEFLWVVLKEASVGVTNGMLLGLGVAIVCFLWQRDLRLSVVVGIAIAANTLVAACLGGVVPLLLKRWRLDPALAAGPILAAITDLFGFLVTLALADWLLLRSLS